MELERTSFFLNFQSFDETNAHTLERPEKSLVLRVEASVIEFQLGQFLEAPMCELTPACAHKCVL